MTANQLTDTRVQQNKASARQYLERISAGDQVAIADPLVEDGAALVQSLDAVPLSDERTR